MEHLVLSPDNCKSDFDKFCDGFSVNSGFQGITRNGVFSFSSLVLDSERGELVEAPATVERKGVSAERTVVALKNHSEAERRRRARINEHLDTLRSIVPGAKKMDKASLLAEVITHMKELKGNASEASKGFLIPTDIDEVECEQQGNNLDGAPCSIRVTLCCDYKPGLLSVLRQEFHALHLMIMTADIATLEGRMKNIFVMTCSKEEKIAGTEACQSLARSVHQALRSVLDRFSASHEFSLSTKLPNKRRRVSLFDSLHSISSGDFW